MNPNYYEPYSAKELAANTCTVNIGEDNINCMYVGEPKAFFVSNIYSFFSL